MPHSIVHARDFAPGGGSHPAGSPFDKRISDRLGLENFAVYRVELPPNAETKAHDHQSDGVEDAYAIVRGTGWLVVDGEEHPLDPGHFAGVSADPTRHIRAGEDGCDFIAVCA